MFAEKSMCAPIEGSGVDASPISHASGRYNALITVGIAGMLAGAVDIAQALVTSGPRVLLLISAGLLGPVAASGGAGYHALGLGLHFVIALIFAAIYYFASRILRFLIDYPILCGLVYGVLVDLSMRLIVLPLSALHAKGPFPLSRLLIGIGVHMITVGLPISFSIRALTLKSTGVGQLDG